MLLLQSLSAAVLPSKDEHELLHSQSGERIACADWEWAELDRKRLVWAKDGKLFAAAITEAGLVNEVQLFDFNDMSFEPIEAPYDRF